MKIKHTDSGAHKRYGKSVEGSSDFGFSSALPGRRLLLVLLRFSSPALFLLLGSAKLVDVCCNISKSRFIGMACAFPLDLCVYLFHPQVLSGDSVIIRGQPKNGPPAEKQINFSNVIAPKLARRPVK